MCRKPFLVTCVLAVLWVAAATLSAVTFDWTTYFTFTKPVKAAGVVLPAGSYVFDITNPHTSADVVRVRDRKRMKQYVLTLTRPVTRPADGRLDASIVFGEGSATVPPPIRAWYPAGETTGREFLK